MSKLFTRTTVAAMALLIGAGAAGCARNKKPDPMDSVSGVIVPEHVTLSPTAVAHVRLADVTEGYVKSETVAERKVRPSEDGTIPFTLAFKESQIDKDRKYAVEVRVVDRERVYFVGPKHHPVLTRGHGDTVEVQIDHSSKF